MLPFLTLFATSGLLRAMDPMLQPAALSWINTPAAKKYLRTTGIPNDPIIILEFSGTKQNCKIASCSL